ncbi:MAG: hypothetical protein MPEBLZ_01787 [Candidatus Methanoperedens nitroreducens]|uniref:Uncharacterized protein n=1 Tax=Candidatus Methanoperedens nitratireducens TaxID=1392998 RepID=A0A0P8AAG4_9EURY|nr:hypothetical protein [Candidatus Methanoperedens sp. BLZ2]KAB2948458.1 MAG: hypothetical protein F9K14_01115 [Candidatus Methanoperedens sp.]KPQ43604.1 MAG: hypothetical protein MPEBLZ_01787 [Candidatus Methanoperedens sp. BLZ1]MBZ0174444.1 hypothetical protein [Candidatus Methanoperedens nitroreducens]MCX9078464.1 hypothetical protein [Candidatus Methanoperedens sp.]
MEMLTPPYTVARIFKGLEGMKNIITYNELIKILDAKLRALEARRSEEEQESTEAIIIKAVDFLIDQASIPKDFGRIRSILRKRGLPHVVLALSVTQKFSK